MEKIDLIVDKIESLKEHHGEILSDIQEDLKYHIKRTDILEDLHKDNAKRIELLEETPKALQKLKQWILGLGAISGAILAILKILGRI